MASTIRYLTAKIAREIDEELMSQAGAFSLDQVCITGSLGFVGMCWVNWTHRGL
ncbi:hypothetical protein EDC04DRAFT_2722342 [Pisolithus marmoratus]|nr:hypothetical protein EDC04DRAFT_2722342 [Pisolithus marmoratus]